MKSFSEFIQDRYGEGNYRYWIDQLSPLSRPHYESRIQHNAWYPITEALVDPVQVFLEMYYGGHPAGARALGIYNAEKALTGFLKFVVKRGSPAFLIRQANSILQKYYRPLESEVPLNEKGRAVVRITSFPEPHLILDYRIQGWMEKALEVSGCKDIRIDIARSIARGDEVTEFHGSWS